MRTFDVVTCRLLFVVLIFSETLLGQAQKPTAPAAAAAKLQKLNVFAGSWDTGELKSCSTYPAEPTLLICDDRMFMEALGNAAEENSRSGRDAGMTSEQRHKLAYSDAFRYATTHSKMFNVRFSGPSMAEMMKKNTSWECNKGTAISCN